MTLELNFEDYKKLKELYNKAVKEGREQFTFKGQELLTSYAKYLLEYLEMQPFIKSRIR